MYIPSSYKNENLEEVKSFVKEYSFGILVNQVEGKPWATHIPMELEKDSNGKDVLVGHIAKANPQWKSFSKDAEVLCIFNGPHAYISSSWYKAEEVPTWDYIAVHIYGTLRVLNHDETMQSLQRLVDRYEASSRNPVSLHHLSPKTLRQVKGIVAFSITIGKIQAAYKLSQNRPEDHQSIIQHLSKKSVTEGEIATQIRKHSKNN
ncbi:MAG: FMN-binding negative transcriptional regulator [Bacteroidota bacterium]